MFKWIFSLLLIVASSLIGYKVFYLGYTPELMLPEKGYRVRYILSGESDKTNINLKAFIPTEDFRQRIFDETFSNDRFALQIEGEGFLRQAVWAGAEVEGPFKVEYRFSVLGKAVSWNIDPSLTVSENPTNDLELYLQETDLIQVQSPQIAELLKQVVGSQSNVLEIVQKSYDHIAAYETLAFKGSTSALTALALRKASCNGKSRLLVALLRRAGIPARVVGGLVMEDDRKRTSHQWVEVFIQGHWVSFDPTNKHFASIPYNYLKIYESDQVLFSHTSDIAFDWSFNINSFVAPSANLHRLKETELNALDLFKWLDKTGVPLGIINILLVIPIGALVATFFRNVVGLQSFGTFLPALIAAAAQETGVWWGLLGFTSVILVLSIIRAAFEKLNLLHTPKLSAMLTVVVILLLMFSVLSVKFNFTDLSRLTLFPIAILTLTTERFSLTIEEKGMFKAFLILFQTLLVTAICYAFMSNLFLQTAFLAFPELTLFVIALNLWLGRWMGLRVSELWRFRRILFKSTT